MLRLVEKVRSVVSFDEAAALVEQRDVLRAEAAEIEVAYGKNAYSDFLVRQGRYSEPRQAATLGQLTGLRVRASDGSMQPRRTKAERETTKAIRGRRHENARYSNQISRLLQAISSLAENADAPEEVLHHTHPQFDDPTIGSSVFDCRFGKCAFPNLQRCCRLRIQLLHTEF
jgi:hypothetical protein